MAAQFTAGKDLSCQLAAIIEPALRELFPRMPLALAFMGAGSDVLGYDTARSMDHDWGPRLTIVVPEDDREAVSRAIDEAIDRLLPSEVGGFPTRYSRHADGALWADDRGSSHRLHVTSVDGILQANLLVDSVAAITDAVWLSTPMQTLLEVTSGEVFCDDSGALTDMRRPLVFYPDHILRYQLSALWTRVGQVQPFIGRTGEVGDDAGSVVIAAGIARDLMRIALLQSGRYAPYAKWLGTACIHTEIGSRMRPHLERALAAANWQEREGGINAAGILLVEQLNMLSLVTPVSPEPTQFHTRPFHVLPAQRVTQALHDSLHGTSLASLTPYVGGIDVVTDSTDALKSRQFRFAMRTMFTHLLDTGE